MTCKVTWKRILEGRMNKQEIEKKYRHLCHQYSAGIINFDQLKVGIKSLEILEEEPCGHAYKRNAYGEMVCTKCGEEQ